MDHTFRQTASTQGSTGSVGSHFTEGDAACREPYADIVSRPTKFSVHPALALAAGLLTVVGVASAGYGALELVATRASRAVVGSGAGIILLAYAVLLRNRLPRVARGLAIGAGLLTLSLTFRTLDQTSCAVLPIGTHFMWHILNATMLAWMIEVWRRHRIG